MEGGCAPRSFRELFDELPFEDTGRHSPSLNGLALVPWQYHRVRMADRFTKDVRSRMMSGIRGRDTLPERTLRSLLHKRGFRFRIGRKDLPGRPDLALAKYGSVIFVHGCFWHQHPSCRYATKPASNTEFWRAKFAGNVIRDGRVAEQLGALGWRMLTVWECELRSASAHDTVEKVVTWLRQRRDGADTQMRDS